jgi:YVTN family beta-propeller protein
MRLGRCGALLAASVAAFALVAGAPGQSARAPTYVVTKSVSLGAPDRWDLVVFEQSSHRVYVAHGDRVSVVDGRSGALIGEATGYPGGTHGVAIVAALGRGFTDDGEAGEAGVFDLATLKTLKRIKTGPDADAIVFDPPSNHVLVVNGDSGTITVIDPQLERAVANIEAGEKLETAVSGLDGKVYVNGAGKDEILRVDTNSNQIDAHWPVKICRSPHGLAIDRTARRLFASCVNKVLIVVNLDSGAIVGSVPIGAGTDAAAFDPVRKLAFSSNGKDGTLSVIREEDLQTFRLVATINTAISARTMDVDPESGRIYLAGADTREPPAAGARRPVVPGSLKLWFLDPH